MKHIKRFNESNDSNRINNIQKYKVIEEFLKEKLGNSNDPVNREDLPDLLIKFGEKIWSHLSEEGWGGSDLDGYEDYLNEL
jgi:RNA recognition motif-containing protein